MAGGLIIPVPTEQADILYGTDSADVIDALAGDDWVSGYLGFDTLSGGFGTDTLSIAFINDTYLAPRMDLIQRIAYLASTFTFDFAAGELSRAIDAPGNTSIAMADIDGFENAEGGEGRDRFIGQGGDNRFSGGGHSDVFVWDGGNDTYDGGVGSDGIDFSESSGPVVFVLELATNAMGGGQIEAVSIENLIGSLAVDHLLGDAGNNRLSNGGSEVADGGADVLEGRGGDDIYEVWSSATSVVETAGGGIDTAIIHANWTMPDGVEHLTMAGTSNLQASGNGGDNTLTGNAGANYMNGNAGADTMTGGAGDDVYVVDNAADLVVELSNGGSDIVYASISMTVPVNVEVLVLSGVGDLDATGTSSRDILVGNDGENTINGAGGFDVMQGGAGNDTYAVDNSLDAVIEERGGGFDNVYSSVDYIIDAAQEIESAILTGNAVVLRGDGSDNQLFGNDVTNVIDGRGGTDYMLGLGGADIFQITPEAGAVDVVGDFSKAEGDRIAFAGFDPDFTTVTQVSSVSFIVSDSSAGISQQFQLFDGYGAAGYSQGGLVLGQDYYFG